MKNFPLFFLVLAIALFCSSCSNSYRLIATNEHGNFIVPPHTDFHLTAENKLRHRYYYVLFPGINSNYEYAASNLSAAEHWSGNIDYFDKVQSHKLFKKKNVKKFSDSLNSAIKKVSKENNYYQSGILDKHNSLYFIQFDFENILIKAKVKSRKDSALLARKAAVKASIVNNSDNIKPLPLARENPSWPNKLSKGALKTTDRKTNISNIDQTISPNSASIESNYDGIAKDLLIEIANQEGEQAGRFHWANSISQNILEKVFEMIPVEENSSLARFGFVKGPTYSLLLINPKISLEIDLDSKMDNPHDTGSKLMNWSSSISTSFYRDRTGNIKQQPSLGLRHSYNPNTLITKLQHTTDVGVTVDVNYYNVANNADLELSKIINRTKYIALYQPPQKSNNLARGAEGEPKNCLVSPDYDLNSQLIFSANTESLLANPNQCVEGIPIFEHVGVFGPRNLILANINITLNNNSMLIPFGRTIGELIQTGKIIGNFKIRRVYKGNLVKMKFNNTFFQNTSLLPMDQLTNK